MSAKLLGMVLEADLPRARKYVLLALADHAKEDGSDVYPSVARIEWMTGYRERQVRTLMDELETDGILVLVRQGGYGPQDTNEYRIDATKLKTLQPFREWANSRKRKGAKTATIGLQNSHPSRVQFSPDKGAIYDKKRVQFSQNKGAKTADELKNNNQELEPLGEPTAARRDPRQENLDTLDRKRLMEWIEQLSPQVGTHVPNRDAELFDRLKLASEKSGLSYTRTKELLRVYDVWRKWPWLDQLDSQQEIAFPETA